MNFSPMNVPLIREEENASRQRALQFRRHRRMSRPRSNQGSIPIRWNIASGQEDLVTWRRNAAPQSCAHQAFQFFPQTKKSVQLLYSKPCCNVYCIFFFFCNAEQSRGKGCRWSKKLSSTPQNLLDREMEKTRAIHSNPPFSRQDGRRVKPRFTLKSYQLQLGFSIAHGGWENVA